jgi:hypothetical protein
MPRPRRVPSAHFLKFFAKSVKYEGKSEFVPESLE